MMRLAIFLAVLLLPLLVAPWRAAAAGKPFSIDDLLDIKSVSDPQLSPNGRHVVFVVSEIDRENSKTNSSLYIVEAKAGSHPRRLTTTPGANNHPRWSPDGKTIAFLSSRGESSQVWLLPFDMPGEPRKLTGLPIDIGGFVWSPDGTKVAATAEVYPGASPEQTAAREKAKEAEKTKVKAFDSLMIRHWMSWDEGKRSHLFVVDIETGETRDVIPDWTANVPPAPFGGSTAYCFTPDSQALVFTSEPLKEMAWSTNTDLWLVPLAGGAPKNLTESNLGSDGEPLFSPDGKALAYLSQARAGFEADQFVLKTVAWGGNGPQGPPTPMNPKIDRPVLSYNWTKEGKILAVIDDQGFHAIVDLASGQRLLKGKDANSASMTPNGSALVYLGDAANQPAEVYLAEADGEPVKLTGFNDAMVRQRDLQPAETFTFKGADGDEVSGLLIRPPGFDPAKKYPVLFLIHGGPQGAWHDEWHGRWNYQLFAAPGYAVVAVNPRGSTGYGQKFTDQISTDWVGRVYEDLMKGLDHALKTYEFLDGDRVAAAGGSYGGFMVNWIGGHTDRFRCLISHAGVFDLHSMYFTTEELWFAEWEFSGPPWQPKVPKIYEDQSPSRFVAQYKTPTLITHGALDFRVPEAQGIGLFTALQRLGVPSRLVLFPDEGHWIQKPHNRAVWWREMHGWLAQYLKK